MDLEEWVMLPHDGLLDYLEDGDQKRINPGSNPRTLFKTDHFMCPSSPPRGSRVVPKHVVPVPIKLDPPTSVKEKEVQEPKEVRKLPIETSSFEAPSVTMPQVSAQNSAPTKEADQESAVSQVSFKKVKENEQFVDMILDSPKSCFKGTFVPQPPHIDAAGKFNFEDKMDHHGFKAETMEATKISSPRIKKEEEKMEEEQEVVGWEENGGGGLNLWKWSLSGIGAICTFGVAAATICIIILGNHQRNKHQLQKQKLRFQIYNTDDDKQRIKQAVHHATTLNEAISAVRGVPMSRAHITFGGYYDGL